MKAFGSARRMLVLALVAPAVVLPACVQPRLEELTTAGNVGGEIVAHEAAGAAADLAREVEALRRYAARMEELYAAQEAEIRALRRAAASLQGPRAD